MSITSTATNSAMYKAIKAALPAAYTEREAMFIADAAEHAGRTPDQAIFVMRELASQMPSGFDTRYKSVIHAGAVGGSRSGPSAMAALRTAREEIPSHFNTPQRSLVYGAAAYSSLSNVDGVRGVINSVREATPQHFQAAQDAIIMGAALVAGTPGHEAAATIRKVYADRPSGASAGQVAESIVSAIAGNWGGSGALNQLRRGAGV